MDSVDKTGQDDSVGHCQIDHDGTVVGSGRGSIKASMGSNISSLYKLVDLTNGRSFSFNKEDILGNPDGYFSVECLQSGALSHVEQSLSVSGGENAINVSWRLLSEEEIQIARKISRKLKKDFLEGIGNITHDFNNVLSVALGHSELATMVSDPEKKEKHFKLSVEALKKIRNLLKTVLYYRHHLDPRKIEVFDISSIVRQCANDLKDKFPDKFQLHFEDKGEMNVNQSRSRMKEIFMNILVNSCESFSDEQVGKITVEITSVENLVNLTFADDGQGISEKLAGKVFDPFFSAHHNLESAGLGLSLVKGILEDIGGSIDIASTPGEGTKVSVNIPKNC